MGLDFNFKFKFYILFFLLLFSFLYTNSVFAWDLIGEQIVEDYRFPNRGAYTVTSTIDFVDGFEVVSVEGIFDVNDTQSFSYVGSVVVYAGTPADNCGYTGTNYIGTGLFYSKATSTRSWQHIWSQVVQDGVAIDSGDSCVAFVFSDGDYYIRIVGKDDTPDIPFYKAYSDFVDSEDPGDTSTRIISVSPEDEETISSSSPATIGFTSYLNEFDVGNTRWDIDVTPYYKRGLASAWYNFASYFPAYSYEIMATTSGVFSFSTTTKEALPENTYYLDVSLHTECEDYPIFGYSCFDVDEREKVSSSTTFYSGKQDDEEKVFSEIPDLFEGAISTTSEALMDSCKISNFDLGLCAYALFVPDSKIMALDFQNFKDVLFTRFPWGYVTRFVDLAYSSNVEPPALVYNFGSSSPAVLQGKGVDIQIYDEFGVLSSIESDQGGGNLWDVVMPFFEVVIWLSVFFVVLLDLLSLNWIFGSSSGGSTSTDEPSEFVSSGGSVEIKKGRSINRSIPKDK